jgi:hypothetical protein
VSRNPAGVESPRDTDSVMQNPGWRALEWHRDKGSRPGFLNRPPASCGITTLDLRVGRMICTHSEGLG